MTGPSLLSFRLLPGLAAAGLVSLTGALTHRLSEVGRVPPNSYVMPYEDALPIFHCRALRRPWAELWPLVKNFN